MTDDEYKEQLIKIINNYGMQKSTTKYIKNNYVDLYAWIVANTRIYTPKNLTESIYIIINGPKALCDNNITSKNHSFVSFEIGYRQFCSKNCKCSRIAHSNEQREYYSKLSTEDKSAIINAHKSSLQEKYGVTNSSQVPGSREKAKQTAIKNYGVDHPMKSDDLKLQVKQTNLEKYGVTSPFQSEDLKEKIRQTNLQNLGVEYPMQSDRVKQKSKETLISNYGVDNIAKVSEIKEKVKCTNIERHGRPYAFLSPESIEKNHNTKLEKYGNISPFASPEVREKSKKTNLDRYGNSYYSQSKLSDEILAILQDQNLFSNFAIGKTFYEICNELQVSLRTVLNYVYKYDIRDKIKAPTVSSYETKVKNLLDNLKINYIHNSKRIIAPLQLDFYLPEHNLAIEVGSAYYHSELAGGKDRNYHYLKWKQCQERDITLLQYFDYDILNNWHLIESKIKRLTHQSIPIIGARKLTINPLVDYKIESNFLETFHLQGASSKRNLVLAAYYNDQIAGITSWLIKDNSCELSRFATDIDYSFPGLFSKMLKYFINLTNFHGTLMSFSDNRHSNGNLYKSIGFRLGGVSNPGYSYTRNFIEFESRIKYQKHKLGKIFNLIQADIATVSEWSIMQSQGFDRMWDAGQSKWLLDIS